VTTPSEKRIKVKDLEKQITDLDYDIKLSELKHKKHVNDLKKKRAPLVKEKVKLTRKKRN
jgi:hypothetical protein